MPNPAAHTHYENLNNVSPGTMYTRDLFTKIGSNAVRTRFVSSGVETPLDMVNESKDSVGTKAFGGLPLKSVQVVKHDGGQATVVRRYRRENTKPFLEHIHPMHFETFWFTEDLDGGTQRFSLPSGLEVDLDQFGQHRVIPFFRLYYSFDVARSPFLLNGFVNMFGKININRYVITTPASRDVFQPMQLRFQAPIVKAIDKGDGGVAWRGVHAFDVRYDGWWKQVKLTDGNIYRLPMHDRALFTTVRFGDV